MKRSKTTPLFSEFDNGQYKFISYIILIAAMSACSMLLILIHNPIYILITIPLALYGTIKLIKLHNSSLKKVAFMFNAIDCDDYNFKFVQDSDNTYSNILNASLNRIKEIMTNAKIRSAEREKYYELIMNSTKSGILTINENGNVYQANTAVIKLFGLNIFTHIMQLSAIDKDLPQILMNIKAGENRNIAISSERGNIELSISASLFKYCDNKLKILSIVDINKALNAKETETWIKLTRVLTHEIMNDLSPITSLSESLLSIRPNSESAMSEIEEGLVTINTTSKNLISFVDSYRKFTKLQTPVKRAFEILTLCKRNIQLIKETTVAPIEYMIDINPKNIMIYADENLISHVILNLLKNAVQAIESSNIADRGKITISSYITENEEIDISVSNNGGKIPLNIYDNIFIPFFTTKATGSGIGLSVCQQIINMHGGTIVLTSNTDTKVTFSIVL